MRLSAARTAWLGLCLIVAACGRQAEPGASVDGGGARVTGTIKAARPASANDKAAADVARLARSDAETGDKGDDAPGDTAARNPMLAAVASTIAATTSTAAAATPAQSPWQEGVNYTRIVPAQPTSVPAGQVEVLEFFWYGCPHCYALDPLIESWKKTKPSYVTFVRVPVMWQDTHRATARLYYAVQSLGKIDQLHTEIFREIHVNGDPLVAPDPSNLAGDEHVQAVFLRHFGISDETYDKAFHSFDVETALQRAEQLGLRYRVEGVPTFVVNGKYVADVASAKGPERLLALVDDLAAQEHKR